VRIRPLRVPDDFGSLAILLSVAGGQATVTEQTLLHQEQQPHGMRYRVVAEDEAGRLVGWACVRRLELESPGQYFVRVVVDGGRRGQGLGARMLADAERAARELGAAYLYSGVRDDQPVARAFAEHHGYQFRRHQFESVLDLRRFDFTAFAPAVEQAKAGGVRLFSLAEEPGEATERQAYQVLADTMYDVPDTEGEQIPPFELWREMLIERPGFRPEYLVLAADGDRVVGTTYMYPVAGDPTTLYTDYTGVLREYRGRQIALALKVEALEHARRLGAIIVRTNNDSDNAAMLAVNRRLGCEPVPGWIIVDKGVNA
jgi:GNAT superfamily N-acetyltransferase